MSTGLVACRAEVLNDPAVGTSTAERDGFQAANSAQRVLPVDSHALDFYSLAVESDRDWTTEMPATFWAFGRRFFFDKPQAAPVADPDAQLHGAGGVTTGLRPAPGWRTPVGHSE